MVIYGYYKKCKIVWVVYWWRGEWREEEKFSK
jgi:hypothetical protein